MRNLYKLEVLSVLKANETLGINDSGDWSDGYVDLDSIIAINYDSHGEQHDECCSVMLINGEGLVINLTCDEMHKLIQRNSK